jgi:hypothetical protein
VNRWWKGLILLLLMVSFFTTWAQLAQIQRWMGRGARFTAQDGQALCERVKALEAVSYGYRDAKLQSQDCHYEER